jgi:hypothetical protein
MRRIFTNWPLRAPEDFMQGPIDRNRTLKMWQSKHDAFPIARKCAPFAGIRTRMCVALRCDAPARSFVHPMFCTGSTLNHLSRNRLDRCNYSSLLRCLAQLAVTAAVCPAQQRTKTRRASHARVCADTCEHLLQRIWELGRTATDSREPATLA